MNINKESWHYRFIKKMDGEFSIPNNLCPYVRKVIIMGALAVLVGSFVIATTVGLLGITGVALGVVAGALATSFSFGAYVFLFVLCTEIVVGFKILWDLDGKFQAFFVRLGRKLFPNKSEAMGDVKEPSIFIEYIKAKHDKICPSLSFTKEH